MKRVKAPEATVVSRFVCDYCRYSLPVHEIVLTHSPPMVKGQAEMSYALVPSDEGREAIRETSEYRRTHYRVYDENGFLSTFGVGFPENATLATVSAHLCETFAGTSGTGYDSKDMVVMLGSRIVAVIRKGEDGLPVVTKFEAE